MTTKITKKALVSSIKARISGGDVSYIEWGISQLAMRQTEHELDSKETIVKNREGFSSSNAHMGTKFALIIADGGKLDETQMVRAASICIFHARQLQRIEAETSAQAEAADHVTFEMMEAVAAEAV